MLGSIHGYRTWEKASFGNTKQHSANHQACEIFDHTREGHDNPPRDNKEADICGRTLELSEE